VLALPHEELVRRTDLEDDTIQEIVRILQSEFE
jgi:N utilization substance protein A